MSKKVFLIIWAACCFWSNTLQSQEFRLSSTLQSNMVIQQNKALKVWGDASTGAVVQVTTSWTAGAQLDTADSNGGWMVSVPVGNAIPGEYTAHTISVSSNGKTETLSNILIGDVWLCSGQSNMDMKLKPFLPWLLGTMHYQQEIANAHYPQIRLLDVEKNFSATPIRHIKGNWSVCSPATVADYSAVAYFFARDIWLQKRIPIGMVVSSVGASTAQAWTSRDSLSADKSLHQKYLYPYDTSARSKEKIDATVTFDKVARPTLLYNAMIHPLQHLGLTGILWYQGESNRHDSAQYTRLFESMINNWRALFKQGEIPFNYVQVAPYHWEEKDSTAFEYALLREAQANVRKWVNGAEMAVTMDIADPSDIHPRNKQDVGFRLASIALANVYNMPVVYKGPEYESFTVVKDTIVLSFQANTIGSGLATNDGQAPKHFYLAGADKKFYLAEAIIKNDKVYLYSSKVKKPIAARYAFTNFPVTNFGNANGFPAVPFRTSF